jgi:hypothetical protein
MGTGEYATVRDRNMGRNTGVYICVQQVDLLDCVRDIYMPVVLRPTVATRLVWLRSWPLRPDVCSFYAYRVRSSVAPDPKWRIQAVVLRAICVAVARAKRAVRDTQPAAIGKGDDDRKSG